MRPDAPFLAQQAAPRHGRCPLGRELLNAMKSEAKTFRRPCRPGAGPPAPRGPSPRARGLSRLERLAPQPFRRVVSLPPFGADDIRAVECLATYG